ncbi:hypothetical protein M9Y10_003521 [Tritrichomonas musculus]|uniref:Autophagy-related protein 11 C-terminal domain-containing protein n=1 Tax=Tritrichomonas musculus TaxID=1915356 RepID=A0ABR2JQ15_9EUKA
MFADNENVQFENTLVEQLNDDINSIDDDKFLELPIHSLDRIIRKYHLKNENANPERENKLAVFLSRYISIHGSFSSILLNNLDFSVIDISIVNQIINNKDLSAHFDIIGLQIMKSVVNQTILLKNAFDQNNQIIYQMQKQIEELNQEIKQQNNANKNETRQITQNLKEKINSMQMQIDDLSNFFPKKEDGKEGQILALNQNKKSMIWLNRPCSIWFYAKLKSISYPYKKISWGHAIQLDNVIFDTANSFDSQLHCYSIPMKGKWLLIGSVLYDCPEKKTCVAVGISKNGFVEYANSIEFSGSGYNEATFNAIYDCELGDKIELCTWDCKRLHSDGTFLQGIFMG